MMAMDFVGPLPLTDSGNKYLLVIADYYTKGSSVNSRHFHKRTKRMLFPYPLPPSRKRTLKILF